MPWQPPFGYPPPPRRSWGLVRIFNVFFLVLFFGGSLLLNVIVLGAAALSGGGSTDGFPVVTTTIKEGDAKQKVAVVTLAGPIDGNVASRFSRLLDQVEKDDEAKTLVVEIDSPGGTVTGSDEIYARLLRYKTERKAAGKNGDIVVTMRSMAASGGYYASCAADYVFAEETTLTGNIGVLMTGFNVSELMEKHGVRETTIVSSGADFKNVGSPFSPETPQGKQYLQTIADQAAARFHAVVKAGRGSKIDGKNVFNAQLFNGPDAVKLGLVDKVGYPDEAYAYAAKSAGLSSYVVVRYSEPMPGVLDMLMGAAAAKTNANIDAANIGAGIRDLARPETLDAWRANRLLYR